MRSASDLRRLYDYNYWANEKLLAVVSQLSPEEFTREVSGSYGSIRNSLVHVLSAEWGWLDRCGGHARGAKLEAADYPDASTLIARWGQVEGWMRGFLAELADEDLARDIEFAMGTGAKHVVPLGDLMHHSVIHAVHHRGQVAVMLRTLGHTPGNFDMLIYSFEHEHLSP
jgi:uncharacterized damage-inducible protein DinB